MLAVPGLAADDGDAAGGGACRGPQAGATVDAPDGHHGPSPKAQDEPAGTGPQDLPRSLAWPCDHPTEPGPGRRIKKPA